MSKKVEMTVSLLVPDGVDEAGLRHLENWTSDELESPWLAEFVDEVLTVDALFVKGES